MKKDCTPLFLRFLESSRSCTLVGYDVKKRITRHNPLFCSILGIQDALLTGRNVEEFIAPSNRDLLIAPATGLEINEKIQFVDTNGQIQPLHCQLFSVESEVYIIGERLMQTNTAILDTMGTLNNELTNLTRELQRKNKELAHANNTIKTLRGIIPICSHCKVIRNDEGYWKEVEVYVSEHTEALFSHSICPKCMVEFYPELQD